MPDPKLRLLRSIPLFEGLGDRQLERISQLMDEVDVPAGRVLMRQGEAGKEMFIIVDGSFAIERDGLAIRECGRGDTLGEMALLSEGSRTATVTASTPGRLLVVGHREFHALLEVAPEISMQLLESLARRLRSLDPDAIH